MNTRKIENVLITDCNPNSLKEAKAQLNTIRAEESKFYREAVAGGQIAQIKRKGIMANTIIHCSANPTPEENERNKRAVELAFGLEPDNKSLESSSPRLK